MEGEQGSLSEAAAVGAAVETAAVAGAAEVTAEHAADAAEDAAAAAEGAAVAADVAVDVAAQVGAQADETQRGTIEILTLHGENISALRAELAADREERRLFHESLLSILNREERAHAEEGSERGEAGSEVTEERLPADAESGGEREAEQQPEARSGGRRYSRHF